METQKPAPGRSSPPSRPSGTERTDSTQEEQKTTYFVSRWEVLQSLLRVPKFICIHLSWQSKTWPLITAWLLWKGGRTRHRSLFYAFDKPETKFQMIKLMLICLSIIPSGKLVWQRVFLLSVDIPLFHSFMPILIEGRAAGEKAGFLFAGGLRSQERRTHPFPF